MTLGSWEGQSYMYSPVQGVFARTTDQPIMEAHLDPRRCTNSTMYIHNRQSFPAALPHRRHPLSRRRYAQSSWGSTPTIRSCPIRSTTGRVCSWCDHFYSFSQCPFHMFDVSIPKKNKRYGKGDLVQFYTYNVQ